MLIINWTHCWNVPLGTRMMTGREKLQCTGHLYRCRRKEGRGGHQRVLGRSPSQPAVCVCFYLCADWWNELWVWEIDSGWGWSPPHPLCLLVFPPCVPSLLVTPAFPFPGLVLPTCFLSLKLKADLKMSVCVCVCWGGDNTNKVGFLVLAVLFYPARRLSAQVKPLHHFSVLHSRCFIVPASQIICLLWESLQPSCLIFHETSSLS